MFFILPKKLFAIIPKITRDKIYIKLDVPAIPICQWKSGDIYIYTKRERMREGSGLYILVLYIVIARTLAKYIYKKKYRHYR